MSRGDFGGEGGDLVAHLVAAAGLEADLQLVHAVGGVVEDARRDVVGGAGQRALAHVPIGLADVEVGRDVPDHHRAVAAAELLALRLQRRHHLCVRRTLRHPPVGETSGAADGGVGGSSDPHRRSRRLDRTRPRAEPVDVLVFQRVDQRGKLLLDELASACVVDAQRGELGDHVAGADPDDGASTRQVVEGGERLGRDERVTVGEYVRVRQQVHVRSDAGEPGERADAVLPVVAHRAHQLLRDRDVVAHPDVEVPVLVGGARDARQLVGPGDPLPVGDVRLALGLNRKLHSEDACTRRNADHRRDGTRGSGSGRKLRTGVGATPVR